MDALHTDLYQLTMAAGYFHRGMTSRVATCELFVRRLPSHRRFLVAMGLDRLVRYLEGLRFTDEEIAYLGALPALADAMTPAFRDYLRGFRFRGDVWAMPEGTVLFANEPLVRVTAPLIEAQLIETFALSVINHATTIASKAARVILAAGDAGVVEFGTRRAHPEAAIDAARAAYAAGCVGTSNVEAGMRFGIPVLGTAAHMWTMAHPTEQAAFESYVAVFPNATLLLIDTYDTLTGAARAAAVARDKLKGVRLDSGDLGALSVAVRGILDAAGCASAKIVASGDLNEHRIAELRRAGAPIDLYGVGTDLVTSIDAPSLGGVYKLVEIGGVEPGAERTPIAKFSEGKATLPGAHQVHRFRGPGGELARDVLALDSEPAGPDAEPLLAPVMRRGARVAPPEGLGAIRARVRAQLDALPEPLRRLDDAPGDAPFEPEVSPALRALVEAVRARVAPGAA
ncbi:nicotinate phosphoribosyltransferase [Sorangium cellulosum]|uniref:Nicotinate phosphoribosyltransferase n=1 Tax=Sorangium cellulosum TaxID=56 RepID=A0A4P2Q125_SORCE|nr:nicotinate phosphoribosyltransferase [Sorangium cellulosum]AUX22937.1 nicotinate phosphoribosyltransferase [Sorangium cellulosum]